MRWIGWSVGVFALFGSGAVMAQDDQALAKQLANPVANLISVPLQYNYDRGIGPDDGSRDLLNIQPVVPIGLTPNWNLISRTILPVIHLDDALPGGGGAQGIGDTTQSFFFSPAQPTAAGLIWGVGPVALLPTASEDALGTGKWGLGPTIVALRQSGPWTVGILANQIWSVAGDEDRPDVNQAFLQPFINYTAPTATSFFLNTESSYDWDDAEWAVPINFGVNQLVTLGRQKVQLGAGARYWANPADEGPDGWGARLIVTFLFPR